MIQTKGRKVADDVSFRTDFAVKYVGTFVSGHLGTNSVRTYVNDSNGTRIGKFVVHSSKGDVDYCFKFDPELYETIFVKQKRILDFGKYYIFDFKIETNSYRDGTVHSLVLSLCDFRESSKDETKHNCLILTTEASVRKPFFTGAFYDTPKCIAVHFNVRDRFWIPVFFRKVFYGASFKKDLEHFPGTVVDLKCAVLPNRRFGQVPVSLLLSKYNVLKLSDFNTESPDDTPVTADDLPI
jgi:hypothetical protein